MMCCPGLVFRLCDWPLGLSKTTRKLRDPACQPCAELSPLISACNLEQIGAFTICITETSWPWQVALFSAELGRYDVAISIFEDTARAAVQNNLLKFSARGHLLNAGICHLCSAFLGRLKLQPSEPPTAWRVQRNGCLVSELMQRIHSFE